MADDADDRERAAHDAHWAALARYLDGGATPAQRAHVERWAAADANRRELADLRALWQLTGVLPTPERVDALWRDLTEKMHCPEAHRPEATAPEREVLPTPEPPSPRRPLSLLSALLHPPRPPANAP